MGASLVQARRVHNVKQLTYYVTEVIVMLVVGAATFALGKSVQNAIEKQ